MIPNDGFDKRGQRGPLIFMTDNCKAERNALALSFPEATLLLCTFHVLQAAWRWLWQSSSNIPSDKRPELLNMLKKDALQ